MSHTVDQSNGSALNKKKLPEDTSSLKITN